MITQKWVNLFLMNILFLLMPKTSNYADKNKKTIFEEFIGEKDWFFLYWIAYYKLQSGGHISTPKLVEKIPLSQQTISRRILNLEKDGYIRRTFEKRGGALEISAKAYVQLEKIFENLKIIFKDEFIVERFQGTLQSGMGEGAHYIKNPKYLEQIYKEIGFFPYFGTLNLEIQPEIHNILMNQLKNYESIELKGFEDESRSFGAVLCNHVKIWPKNDIHNQVKGALLQIKRTSHKKYVLEFISEQYLRDYFKVKDGDEICFQFNKNKN